MKLKESSFFVRLINLFDIQENSFIFERIKESFILSKTNNFIEFTRKKLRYFSLTSKILEKIDWVILFLVSLTFLTITFASTKIIGFLILLSFITFIIKYIFNRKEKHFLNPFDLGILVYLIIAGLSVIFSYFFIPSLKGYLKILLYVGSYLTFLNIMKSHPKRLLFLTCLLVFSASIESLYAIYQKIVGVEQLASWQDTENVNPEQLMKRVFGSLQPLNPNLLAGYLIAPFALSLGTGFYFLNNKKIRQSLICFAGSILITLGIIFTGSRGAYMSLFSMFLSLIAISGYLIFNDYSSKKCLKKLWISLIILGIILSIFVFISFPSLQHRIMSIFAFREDSSNSYRFNVYASSINMFFDNWFIGIGPGNITFRLIYGIYMITGFDALGAYSVPLEIAVESGIFGLLAFLWIIFLGYIKSVKYIIKKNLIENKILLAGFLLALTGLMTHGMVDTVFFRPQINIIFWFIIASIAIITLKKNVNKSVDGIVNNETKTTQKNQNTCNKLWRNRR